MKKIIFITNYFGNGGAATVMKTLIENLPINEYDISLISFLDDDNKYNIPVNTKYINLTNSMKLNTLQKIKAIFKLRKILRKNKNTVVISFEYFINMRAIIANCFLHNKLIVSERNDPSRIDNTKRILRNFLYKFANVLVCQTDDAKNYFSKKIQKKTIVIPNPIRTQLPSRYIGKRNNKIVTFCRVEKQKNLYMMLDAFKIFLKKFPQYSLEIYGDGSEKNGIIEYSKKIHISNKVFFKGFKKDLHNEIVDCAMFISTSDFEGISNSMLEAMAIGLPTICTDCPCGGAKMAIKNGVNGLLSPVGDCEQFAQKMIYLVSDEKLMDTLSKNSVKIKEEYSPSKIFKKWVQVIEKNG
ncbi:MAG: glycosyltransferase [Bacilli bacterium]|nr:glycosyltransferase [Bacilli bacterium]